ncbi:regulatory protein RecX [Psychrobacter sp. I-STPA6b]|uniref:regulatory protein RecX n=1 Tax=Psychrobacter sp. I-STPA6b TaxID=2585718 RepID=UPI001D0C9268|nr:regulatory protein RecX [Psychrobacter sp. I-STPA6b]
MQIKTLAEILAEQEQAKDPHSQKSANTTPSKKNKTTNTKQHTDQPKKAWQHNPKSTLKTKAKSSKKVGSKSKLSAVTTNTNHQSSPVYQPPSEQTLKEILSNPSHTSHTQESIAQDTQEPHITQKPKKSTDTPNIDTLPEALQAYLKTPEQRLAEKEKIKAESRLRWLAFYYLSRREHSAAELKQKLLDKDQDPQKIDELLQEFAEKGYQSDMRTALMLIREGIRKRRGRTRIKQDFYQRQVAIPCNIDELIDMANAESDAFCDVVSENELVEGVDWLKLAVEARVKKYGDAIPSTAKDKAKQLRFLQYRGFQTDICFDAIKYNLSTLTERF